MTLSDNARGALYMSLSMAGFTCNDAIVKLVTERLPLFETIFLRGLFAAAFIGALAYARGALAFRPRRADWGPLGLRTAAEIGATVFFLTALTHMPLANATAVLQTAPLAVTMAAALVLREAVGWRRWSAIAIGFLGVLLIVRPGADGFDLYALYALVAVGFVTLRDLATRRMTAGTPTLYASTLTAGAVAALGGAATLAGAWTGPTAAELGLLAAGAVFLLVGYVFGVEAMRVGELSVVTPFRYSIMIWALLLGWVVFAEAPDAPTLVGAAVVAAAGLYTLRRERLRAAAAAAAPPPGRSAPSLRRGGPAGG